MELTQRLPCTQSFNETPTQSNRLPEQIGFLGICGQKYPVVKGPNKIGRDPETCSIVLQLNSISRHHAVINVLNSSEFMLMDLNSANKTKLDNKTLEPYIPYPLKNGNMVQLGQVFGIFSVLQDNNDLPMTQALDIPDTPVVSRHVSKFSHIHVTTVPESPDMSDKDDSFIMPSQPKALRNSNANKSAGQTEPTAKKKIDNNFWNSSRKSDSIHLQSNTTICSPNSFISTKNPEDKKIPDNIHEMNTQVSNNNNESTDSLFTAETQMPENRHSLNIFNMETQLPVSDKLPAVCKVNEQENLALDFFTDMKENDIFEAETQAVTVSKPSTPIIKHTVERKSDKVSLSHNASDDVIVFDEMESEPPIEVFESQALLTEHEAETQDLRFLHNKESVADEGSKRNKRLKSDSSTDCEDDMIHLSQNFRDKHNNDDDETDCDDVHPNEEGEKKPEVDDDLTDCEDDLLPPNEIKKTEIPKNELALEDLPTQIVAEDETKIKTNEDDCIDDMLTQVIQVNENEDNIEDMLTQVVIPEDDKKYDIKPLLPENKPSNSPFKIPLSPMKTKKDIKIPSKKSLPEPGNSDKYDLDFCYASTQDVFNDLCSQREIQIGVSPPTKGISGSGTNNISESTAKSNVGSNKNYFIDVAKPKKVGSGDSLSDVESTPKKVPLTFMETDLPDSQEIKSSMTRSNRTNAIELSSESETENDSEQSTPVLFRHPKKKSSDAKMNLSNKFEIDALPTRIITRVRKPTAKALSNLDTSSIAKNILKPKFLPEQEENIDNEIITENLTRLKNKATKASSSEKSTKRDSTKSDKKKTDKEDKETEKTKRKPKEKSTDKKQTKSNSQNTMDGYLNVTEDKTKASRTTRSRAKNIDSDKKSTSPEVVKSKRKKPEEPEKEKKETKKSIETEQTVRRSRRRKADDDEQKVSKETEKSKVYSVNSSRNSESSLDSSNALKRSTEPQFPSAKKPKMSGGRYTIDTQYVLFTAFPNEEVKNKLESLGAIVVSDVMHCTVVLTLQIKRTFKLLCAVGLGRPVVGPAWVQACADANCILDPNQYILRDAVSEQRFQFDLQKTIRSRRNFLKGYKVSSTPKVVPNAKEMKMIVECSGGTWKEGGKNWLCISCPADRPLWPKYKRKGAIIVSTELVLLGVLRQELDIEGNKLA
ncbi:mediator of DNA damage checkpoint protein 1-like [Aricia agestis]|uniref:mediator of DNA damage checkpoint protein 1-like n=1 Tax=Aricia agestis TaxID=91739 RepID=UPI001C20A70A|nr:mediator of DNA damage checkpoint protein 1-like [Aricia agestis]